MRIYDPSLRSRALLMKTTLALTTLAFLALSPLADAQLVDPNSPGILEPVTSKLQGREVRAPNTDQSTDGIAQSNIHGTPTWIEAAGAKSILGHDITRIASPNDDLRAGLIALLAAAKDRDRDGMQGPARELVNILKGTTVGRIYDGFAMLNYNRGAFVPDHVPGEYKMKRVRDTGETRLNPFDPNGGEAKIWEVDINMLYYDGQIDSDTFLLRFPFGPGSDPELLARIDDTVRINYHIYSLVDEDFSPTTVMLDRRQQLSTVQFPYKGLDAVWLAFEAGQVLDVTVNYPAAGMFRGVYTWGWREHPPRIQFMQPIFEIRNAHTGEIGLNAQGRSYATRNREDLTLDTIGEAAPEMKMLRVAEAALAGVNPAIIERWLTIRHAGPRGTWQEWADLVKNQIQLPEEAWDILAEEGIARGQTGPYDMISVFLNNEMYGTGPFLSEIKEWNQGEVFNIKLINLDEHSHYFRNVDFGPRLTDDILHCCGGGLTSFEIFNFKGTYGVPKVAEMQWRAGWGFRPHFNIIQQSDVFSRGQDRVRVTPYRGGQGETYFGYQWSAENRRGDFRFNPPNFIIEDGTGSGAPSQFKLKGADGQDGFVIGQFTEGFGIVQMCPDDPPGFCTDDFGPANPHGVVNRDSDGDGVNDELHFPPFLRNPAQGQTGAGDVIPPTGAWAPFLWINPRNGSLYIDPDDKSKGYWADLTYIHGRPIPSGQSLSAAIELPRASGQVFYQFDDLFHDNSIFSPHPVFASFEEASDEDQIVALKVLRDGLLRIRGKASALPSGDYSGWVSLYDGPAGPHGCTGTVLVSGPVRQTDGLFVFRCGTNSCISPLGSGASSTSAPGDMFCVQTAVGAFADSPTNN